MKYLKFLVTGVLFGLVMAKAEIISWFRIYEMFLFDSFHMYGIIGSSVILGALLVFLIKRKKLNTLQGEQITFQDKNKSTLRYLLGGSMFGLGWALAGACPGPMFVLLGYGYLPILLVILGAIAGTFLYGLVREALPH